MNQTEVKAALAAQEEHIKRERSCMGVVGLAHGFRRFGNPSNPKVVWSQCIVCNLTETNDDYEIKMQSNLI
jgi:hypothetical protein